jgi:hypothetical protein
MYLFIIIKHEKFKGLCGPFEKISALKTINSLSITPANSTGGLYYVNLT